MFRTSFGRWLAVSAVVLNFAMAVGASCADQAAGREARGEGVSAHAQMDRITIFGPYHSQRAADDKGGYELEHGGGDGYAAGYAAEDPADLGRGPGYYVAVHYP
jgi:hypothetical protein